MHKFSLEVPIEEMDEADLRSTLDEFMEKHDDDVQEFAQVEKDLADAEERIEGLEAEVDEFGEVQESLVGRFAEVVADAQDLFDADELADRFSLDELIEKADNLGAFSLEAPEVEAPEGNEDDESTFANKPDRAPVGDDEGRFSDDVSADLERMGILQ